MTVYTIKPLQTCLLFIGNISFIIKYKFLCNFCYIYDTYRYKFHTYQGDV
jgi:hypothetical protein